MDESTQPGGHANGRVYVKFGPADTQEVQLATAEQMLTSLYQSNPALFGRLLQAAMGISGARR